MFLRKYMYGGYALYLYNQTCFITALDTSSTELSFDEAWRLGGTFVFLPSENVCSESFLPKFILFTRSFRGKPLFLWVENPDSPRYSWRVHSLHCSDDDGVKKVIRAHGFLFSPYVFLFRTGASVTPDFDDMQFHLEMDRGTSPLSIQLSNVVFAARINVAISMDGSISFQAHTDYDKSVLRDSGVGLKYCRLLLDDVEDAEEAYQCNYINEIYNPVFECEGGIDLDCKLHPSDPLHHERTYFQFPSGRLLKSNFTNTRGSSLTFQTTESSKLVFQEYPYSTYVRSHERYFYKSYYLTYMGGFQMKAKEKEDLLLGLAATEYCTMSKGDSIITFEPSKAAFLTDSGLDETAQTAWIKLPAETLYYSQSNASSFFHYSNDGYFRFYPLAIMKTAEQNEQLPVFPYKNLFSNSPNNTKVMEIEKLIYANRYFLLTGHEPVESYVMPARNDSVTVVTPQGVLAEVAGDSQSKDAQIFQWIAIGNSAMEESESGYIRLMGVDFTLGTLFMKSDLMLLFKEPKDILEHVQGTDNFKMDFLGFQFSFDPVHWRKRTDGSSTMMIVKYSTNESIKEAFSDSDTLNASIRKCFDEQNELKKQYAEFYHAVSDKAFMGVIILNCQVKVDYDSSDFMKELRPVLEKTGPDADIFAHHIIIRRNKFENVGQRVCLKKSSVSLLIDYESDDQIAYDKETVDYSFLTTAFRFAVKDGEIKEISTVSELLINLLFDVSVGKDSIGGNCLIIDGTLQKSENTQRFVYSLRDSNLYDIPESMLCKVRIDGVTLTSRGADLGYVFTLKGGLFFQTKNEVDLFSYGEGEEDDILCNNGLLFNALKIYMPNQAAMYASYDDVSLDQGNSKPRKGSFADVFPTVLESLAVEKNRLPDKLGFTAIKTSLTVSAMEAPWYGLLWRIPLGSLGGLSGSSGLELKILMAWGKGKDGQGLYMGVSLPGIASGLDLQGILKLGFSSVMLLKGECDVGYVIKLHQYTVQLLGLSFPKGVSDVYIFADKETKKLGWYAAYME